MKINKKNPRHILIVGVSLANSVVVVCARRLFFRRRKGNKIIIFYGHTLNGNLKSFYDYLLEKDGYSPYFLSINKKYNEKLKSTVVAPKTILSTTSLKDMMILARAGAVFTSHGFHFLNIRSQTDIKFVDVGHAISYKGFDAYDYRGIHEHDEIWISSKYIAEMYKTKFGFEPKKVKVTGYGRSDQLINGTLNRTTIINKYSIPKAKKYILIAPTWKQDDEGRDILPFGLTQDRFFKTLDSLAEEHSAYIIFRAHLNSGDKVGVKGLRNVGFMPYSKYEILEDFLFIADILINDWSSTGIDFLPLKRPTIFLDVPAPFAKGFELGPEFRYGDIVGSMDQLCKSLKKYLIEPNKFIKEHKEVIDKTIKVAYGDTLDGKSTERYYKNLERLLNT